MNEEVKIENPVQKANEPFRALVKTVQDLSMARDINRVMEIVRRNVRTLSGADGAAFVLRDGDLCYYADEEAIGPLWKGQRFPISTCISGWVMENKKTAVIEDITVDPRIPQEAYSVTFVKSLVMIPIRTQDPLGAVGAYWKDKHLATPGEIEVLEALANTAAIAIENIKLCASLQKQVDKKNAQLDAAHYEIAAFSYSVSNDLQAPLQSIEGYTQILNDVGSTELDSQKAHCFHNIASQTRHMSALLEDLRKLAEYSHVALQFQSVDLGQLARDAATRLEEKSPERKADFRIQKYVKVEGDSKLLGLAMEQLISNAWKYTARTRDPVIEFGAATLPHGNIVYYVKDNGAGFDMKMAEQLFVPFQRLHRENEFTGTGIGLATVQRIIHRHGGRIWVDAEPHRGASFYFTLGGD